MTYTLTDLFCGAGGSSTGAIDVPGVDVRVASNHWQLAIDTHHSNHQQADHICADLSQINPRYFPATDLLWASPECTNHSRAKGRKRDTLQTELWGESLPDAAAERSRATMWDVPRFAETHRYKAILVENVVEAAQWLPFRAWLMAMDSLGYQHHLISLNSMHAGVHGLPAPQSRDRLYIAFWRKGDRRPDFADMQRPQAWCPTCGETVRSIQTWKKHGTQVGRYRQQYVYRCPKTACRGQIVEPAWLPAASIIDWTLKGERIGDRARPLAEKTRRRIAAGIARYWQPLVVEAAGNTYDAASPTHPRHGDPNSYYRAWPTDEPLRSLHTSMSKALAIPVEGRADIGRARTVADPLRTQNTRLETGLAQPPFIAELRGGGSTARPTTDPLATVTASGNHHALVTPAGGTWNDAATSSNDVFRSMTTREAYALVMRNNSSRNGDGAEMVTPATEPIRTITTKGHQSVLTTDDIEAAAKHVDDVYFRMLEPSECKRAMAFPAEYVMLGNRREQVRLAGNAVTPPAARDLIHAVIDALEGDAA